MVRILAVAAIVGIACGFITGNTASATPHPPQGACSAYDATIEWLEAPSAPFSICYTAAYADDVPWVRSWLTYAHWRLTQKYAVTELRTIGDATPDDPTDAYQPGVARLHVNVMLLPQPDGNADTGTTRFMHGWGSPADDARYGAATHAVRHAFIPYLTPSAPDWARSDRWGGLGAPAGHFHTKNLLHEYTHAVQHTIRVGEEERRAWNYLPQWVTEGLAEYEGLMHTTEWYRTTGVEALRRKVVDEGIVRQIFRIQNWDGEASLFTTDVYWGGQVIMAHLAELLGEEVHVRLVRHAHPTFDAALAAELAAADRTLQEVWDGLRAWVEGDPAQGVEGNLPLPPS